MNAKNIARSAVRGAGPALGIVAAVLMLMSCESMLRQAPGTSDKGPSLSSGCLGPKGICDKGTVWDPKANAGDGTSGACVSREVAHQGKCGQGTTYDASKDRCIPSGSSSSSSSSSSGGTR